MLAVHFGIARFTSAFRSEADIRDEIAGRLLLLRVVGRLPWLGDCDGLGRQASDKPQWRKPRAGMDGMVPPAMGI